MNEKEKKDANGTLARNGKKHEVTILIAEDDDGHVELITSALRDAGVLNEVIRFRDGVETLAFFYGNKEETFVRKGHPYLLLLDIRMPKMGGIQVLERLKEDPRFKKMPVVMLTTTEEPREIERCHALGCNVYITKPIVFTDFVEKLRRLGLFITIVTVPSL